jgi:2-iminobutanoate/2-iminopropanoate deaminase
MLRAMTHHLKGIRAEGLSEPVSHYTDAVLAGKTLYISGCVAFDAGGNLIGRGDVVAQARQVLANIGRVLAAAGATPADVARVTVYLRDVDDRPKINPLRQEFFGEHRPASTLVEVSALVHPDLLIEIDAVAVLPQND